MITVVVLIAFKPKVKLEDLQERLTGKYLWLGIFVFFFIGIYGGFINAGIGFVIILYLNMVHRMNLVRVNATKVAVVFMYTLSALGVFIFHDKIIWKVGLVLAIGNIAGAWFSSRISVAKGDSYIKAFLVVMVIALAIRLWFFN
jgi:uncharacterized membrane protein YfcA